VIIQSYRRVFSIERRMHKLDPTRPAGMGLNAIVPASGFSIRAITYAVTVLVLSVLLYFIPVIREPFVVWPWWIRHIVVPCIAAYLLMRWEPDGRRADLTMFAIVSHFVTRVRAWKPAESWKGKVRVRWDTSGDVLRRGGRIHGPAAAEFSVPVSLADRWNGWHAEHDASGKRQTVVVPPSKTLKVRP
jgi:hypothetical protein